MASSLASFLESKFGSNSDIDEDSNGRDKESALLSNDSSSSSESSDDDEDEEIESVDLASDEEELELELDGDDEVDKENDKENGGVNENCSRKSIAGSQRSRSQKSQDQLTNFTCSMFKTGNLALVWTVGNEELSSFGATSEIKNVSLKANLKDLCALVKKVYPHLMLTASTSTVPKKNVIGLVHIGLLLKGLAIILHLQLQVCKKSITADYERLKKPMVIDLPNEFILKKSKRVKELSPMANELIFGDMDVAISADAVPMSRVSHGMVADVQLVLSDEILEPNNRNKKSNKNGSKKRNEKGLNEKEILSLLEKRGDELQINGNGFTIIGDGFDLPEPGMRNDFLDSCPQEILPPIELARGADRSHIEKSPSPTRSQMLTEELPVAPRKRVRQASDDSNDKPTSLILQSLETNQGDVAEGPKSKKRKLFSNGTDIKTALTLEELLKLQKPGLNMDEARKLIDRVTIPSKRDGAALAGLNLITNCGRSIPSTTLRNMIVEYSMNVKKIRKGLSRDRKVLANATQDATNIHQIQEERMEEVDLDPGFIVANAEEPVNMKQAELDTRCDEVEHVMIPLQAEPAQSQESSNISLKNMEHAEIILELPKKTLAQIVGVKSSRRKVAHVFVILLKMQGQRKLSLTQDMAYGPIYVQRL